MSVEIMQVGSKNSLQQYKGQNALLGDWITNDTQIQVSRTFEERKLREFKTEDMQSLVETMAKWHLLLGVTSDATASELTFICQFLYDNFPNLTLADITLAMNWAISGKTEIGFVSQKNLSSYYVSKAIQAYLEAKKAIVDAIIANRERHLQKEAINQTIELTPEEKANNFKDHLIAVYKWYEERGDVNDLGDMVYNWTKKAGLFKPTPELIQKALTLANEKYLNERKAETMNGMINNTIDPKTEENRKKKLARGVVLGSIFMTHSIFELIQMIDPSQFQKES